MNETVVNQTVVNQTTRTSVPAPADVDRNGLARLGRDECLTLLAEQPVGRVGVSLRALPVILPVNFVVATPPGGDEPVVVLRSAEGTKLTAALDHCVVAFEVDGFDAVTHSGWSVLVQGLARVLTDPDELAWARTLPLLPWAIEGADHIIALDVDVVDGRRFDPTLRHSVPAAR